MSGLEIVGLAFGVAGLYSSCIDAAERVQAYNSFKSDSQVLDAQFNAERLRLEIWGERIGLKHLIPHGGKLPDQPLDKNIHRALRNPKVLEAVENSLLVIENICLANDDVPKKPTRTKSGLAGAEPNDHRHGFEGTSKQSRRTKLAWAFGGKGERTTRIKLFCDLVQQLHNLVPVYDSTHTPVGEQGEDQGQDMAENAYGSTPVGTTLDLGMSEETREILARLGEASRAATRRELNSWLLGRSLSNEIYESAVEKRLSGTCDWILERSIYANWTSSWVESSENKPKLLWIYGPAGFGKTMLCSRVVQHLSSTLTAPVAYFFLSADFQSRSDPYMAIRSWLSQLVAVDQAALELASHTWMTEENREASRRTVLKLLAEVVQKRPDCVLILDGLDECAGMELMSSSPVSDFLEDLDKSLVGTRTRVMIFSRDTSEIRQALESLEVSELIKYKILPEDVHADNAAYSQSIVDRRLPNKSLEIRTDLSQKMADRCEGQFIWVKMQGESLIRGLNKRQLYNAIDQTPTEIESIYDQNWMRIMGFPGQERRRAFSLLRLAAFALRPLTVAEVAEAVLVECEELGEEEEEKDEDFPMLELPDDIDEDYVNSRILDLCAPLVEVRSPASDPSPALQTIHLTHFSVKEYLLRKLPPQALLKANGRLCASNEQFQNALLAKLCLRYLAFEAVWGELPLLAEDISFEASFRKYAASSWHQHVNSGGYTSQVDLMALVMEFLSKSHRTWDSWRSWFDAREDEKSQDEESPEEGRWGDRLPEPLYYAVKLNLDDAAISLIRKVEWDEDRRTVLGNAALWAACEEGNIAVAKELLDLNCDINATTKAGRTALLISCIEGHSDVVKLLLDKGAKHAIADTHGTSPMETACLRGHSRVISLLLQAGADPNAPDKDGWPHLSLVADKGHLDAVRILLEHGADIDREMSPGGYTALYLASFKGHLGIVKLLLEKGANAAIPNSHGWTPLNCASKKGYIDIVRLLLENGAHIATATSTGMTPLHSASIGGHLGLVKIILEKGGDIVKPDHGGWTPLNCASEEGHLDVVKFLLEKGGDIATPDNDGWTPLNTASYFGHLETVKFLLDNGADITEGNNTGRTPLSAAAQCGHLHIVKLLHSRGADIAAKDTDGDDAINAAAIGGHTDIIRFLLDHGADIATTNNLGRTPLITACVNNRPETAELLLNRGADISGSDDEEWTPILLAATTGYIELFRLLLDHGADVTVPTSRGSLPFTMAALNGNSEIVEILLEKSFMTEALIEPYLMGAAMGGHTKAVELLLAVDSTAFVDLGTKLQNATPKMNDINEGPSDPPPTLGSNKDDDPGAVAYGHDPLLIAAVYGHTDAVKMLLDDGRFSVGDIDWKGSTRLCMAIRNGHIETTKVMLTYASNECLNATDGFGRTPLWWARQCGENSMPTLLIDEAKKRGIQMEFGDEGPVEFSKATPELTRTWCDSCSLKIPGESEIYMCLICINGSLAICFECHGRGIRCLGSHTLVRRTVSMEGDINMV